MAIEYRDIGQLGDHESDPQVVDTVFRSQVYTATHDGDGNRLPFMNRSFISFSYGGKLIEDFGFIAITENNSIQRNIYADFTDNTTDSDVVDGQIYWSTHFDANSLDIAIFTDGVTESELEEFKHWFRPGIQRELILAEHPNRAIMARLSKPPEYSILPFEQKTSVVLAGKERLTSTTLYKGRINLSFVMDDPFWYACRNILDVSQKKETIYEKTDIQITNKRGPVYLWSDEISITDSWQIDEQTGTSYQTPMSAYRYSQGEVQLSGIPINSENEYIFSWPTIIGNAVNIGSYERNPMGVQPYTAYWRVYKYRVCINCYKESPLQLIDSIELIDCTEQRANLTKDAAEAPIIIPKGEKVVQLPEGTQKCNIVSYYWGMINIPIDYFGTFKVYAPDAATISYWKDANDNLTPILTEPDAIKIILEDRVPTIEIKAPHSDNIMTAESLEDIVLLGTSAIVFAHVSADKTGSLAGQLQIVDANGAVLGGAQADYGHVAYYLEPNAVATLEPNKTLAIYYPGTAPGRPELSFKLTPSLGTGIASTDDALTQQSGYINVPGNSFAHVETNPYTSIFLKGYDTQTFKFTTPSIWTGYNQALWIFYNSSVNLQWEELRQMVRDNVRHFAPRDYAIKIIDSMDTEENLSTTTALLQVCQQKMREFLIDTESTDGEPYPAVFAFDSKLGRAVGKFTYNILKLNDENILVNEKQTLEEDVGDMVRSKYLKIMERNKLSEDGYIKPRTDEHPEYSQLIYHDAPVPLEEFNFKYQYLYL